MISLIAAISKQTRAIGKDNGLIWDLPGDMARFRQLTKGHPVIMGRKTWESLPENHRPLPGRANIVITRNAAYEAPGACVVSTMSDALMRAGEAEGAECVYVIGGGEIYTLALPYADRLDLTEVDDAAEGDAHFPLAPDFHETAHEEHEEHGIKYAFVTYERASSST